MKLTLVNSADQVFEAVGRVKANAPAFCTNFFPVQSKLERWIWNAELSLQVCDSAAFFLRRDRDFWRLYFCAARADALQSEIGTLSVLRSEPVVLDVLGKESALASWGDCFAPAGLRPYSRLQRMGRIPAPGSPIAEAPAEVSVTAASTGDAVSILALLEDLFDQFADQLPELHEIEAAIGNQQVLTVKSNGSLAAALFFETQGLTSSIRFWAVSKQFQSRHFGAALMRTYFSLHHAVRRFNLWVAVDNQNAVQKYQHYGYSADGLLDLILVNERIRS